MGILIPSTPLEKQKELQGLLGIFVPDQLASSDGVWGRPALNCGRLRSPGGWGLGKSGSGYLELLEEVAVVGVSHRHIVILALLLVQ